MAFLRAGCTRVKKASKNTTAAARPCASTRPATAPGPATPLASPVCRRRGPPPRGRRPRSCGSPPGTRSAGRTPSRRALPPAAAAAPGCCPRRRSAAPPPAAARAPARTCGRLSARSRPRTSNWGQTVRECWSIYPTPLHRLRISCTGIGPVADALHVAPLRRPQLVLESEPQHRCSQGVIHKACRALTRSGGPGAGASPPAAARRLPRLRRRRQEGANAAAALWRACCARCSPCRGLRLCCAEAAGIAALYRQGLRRQARHSLACSGMAPSSMMRQDTAVARRQPAEARRGAYAHAGEVQLVRRGTARSRGYLHPAGLLRSGPGETPPSQKLAEVRGGGLQVSE